MLLKKGRQQIKDVYVLNGMQDDTTSVFVELLLPNVPYLDKDKMEDKEVYPLNQRTRAGIQADERLIQVKKWLENPLERPDGLNTNISLGI